MHCPLTSAAVQFLPLPLLLLPAEACPEVLGFLRGADCSACKDKCVEN